MEMVLYYKGVNLLFENTEVYLRQRGQSNKEHYKYDDNKAGFLKGSRLHFYTSLRLVDVVGLLALLAAGYLLGRAFLLGELLPFGVALVSAGFVVYRGYAMAALIGAVLGLGTVVSGSELVVRVVLLMMVSAVSLTLPPRLPGFHYWLGGLVFAVLVVAGAGYTSMTGPTTYDYVRVLFEAIFGSLLAISYMVSFGGLRHYATGHQINGEQAFCLVVLLLSIVAAAGQVNWGMISPGGIFAALTVLVAGYVGGAGLGAAAGAVVGVVPGLVFTISPAALGAFAFAGFLGGLCRGMKRIGVVAGFLLGSTILIVYLGSGRDIAGLMVETAVAGLLFLLLPKVVFTIVQKNMPMTVPWVAINQSADGVMNGFTDRFKRWETVFEEVAYTYDQVCGSVEPQRDDAPWQSSINEVKNMVCNSCALNKVCWEREYPSTLLYLETCFVTAQSNGLVTLEDLDSHLRQRCSRPRELVMAITCCYQLWRMQQFLGQRLHESRELASVQLRGMRGVIENLARELEAGNDTWWRIAECIKQSLKQSGIPVTSLLLYPSLRGREVEVAMPACSGKKRCVYDVPPFINQLSEQKLFPPCMDCVNWQNEHFCAFRFYPELTYQLGLGLAKSTGKGSDISGDNCAVMHLNNGQLALLISDGMGSGSVAASESKTTLALLQQLLKAGYNRDLAIRMVNSVMMHHCPEEDIFATVDMCVVDLYEGNIELTKIGAPPSFLVRQNQVQVIQASSLPVGIVDDINISTQYGEINNGDMLVMVTDGVSNAYPATAENEEWIASVLREIVALPPQEVAELILRLALSGNGEGQQMADDMTVLVARVNSANPNN